MDVRRTYGRPCPWALCCCVWSMPHHQHATHWCEASVDCRVVSLSGSAPTRDSTLATEVCHLDLRINITI